MSIPSILRWYPLLKVLRLCNISCGLKPGMDHDGSSRAAFSGRNHTQAYRRTATKLSAFLEVRSLICLRSALLLHLSISS